MENGYMALKSVLESTHNNFMAYFPFDVLLIWWFILQKTFSHVEKQFDERYVIIICNDSTQGTNNDRIPHMKL